MEASIGSAVFSLLPLSIIIKKSLPPFCLNGLLKRSEASHPIKIPNNVFAWGAKDIFFPLGVSSPMPLQSLQDALQTCKCELPLPNVPGHCHSNFAGTQNYKEEENVTQRAVLSKANENMGGKK